MKRFLLLCAFCVVSGAVTQETLGPVVAVKRSFPIDLDLCSKTWNKTLADCHVDNVLPYREGEMFLSNEVYHFDGKEGVGIQAFNSPTYGQGYQLRYVSSANYGAPFSVVRPAFERALAQMNGQLTAIVYTPQP